MNYNDLLPCLSYHDFNLFYSLLDRTPINYGFIIITLLLVLPNWPKMLPSFLVVCCFSGGRMSIIFIVLPWCCPPYRKVTVCSVLCLLGHLKLFVREQFWYILAVMFQVIIYHNCYTGFIYSKNQFPILRKFTSFMKLLSSELRYKFLT